MGLIKSQGGGVWFMVTGKNTHHSTEVLVSFQ